MSFTSTSSGGGTPVRRLSSFFKRSDNNEQPAPLSPPKEGGGMGLRRFSFKFMQQSSSSVAATASSTATTAAQTTEPMPDENAAGAATSSTLRSNFTHEFSRRMSLDKLAVVLASSVAHLGGSGANSRSDDSNADDECKDEDSGGGNGDDDDSGGDYLVVDDAELAVQVAALHSVIADRPKRQALVNLLLEHRGDFIQKVRFISCVDEFLLTADNAGEDQRHLDMGRDIFRFFVDSNALFKCSGIPSRMAARLSSGVYDDFETLRDKFLGELAGDERVVTALDRL